MLEKYKYLRCWGCPKPSWKRIVIPFYFPPFAEKPPCKGGFPIYSSYHDEPIGYFVPCIHQTTPQELQVYFPAVQIRYSVDIFLLGDPPQEEEFSYEGKEVTLEWVKDAERWWVHVGPTNVSSLIKNIRRGFKKIGKPLLILEGNRRSGLVFRWILPDHLNRSYDSLRTFLIEVWGEYLDENPMMLGNWHVTPVLLASVQLTSSYLRKLTRLITLFYSSEEGKLLRTVKKALRLREEIENIPVQDPLYVDPEWYK